MSDKKPTSYAIYSLAQESMSLHEAGLRLLAKISPLGEVGRCSFQNLLPRDRRIRGETPDLLSLSAISVERRNGTCPLYSQKPYLRF